MNQGEARVGCPRCAANNFAGKATCWKCGASLPPPEAAAPVAGFVLQARPPQQSVQQPVYAPDSHSRRTSRRVIVVPAVLLVLACAAVAAFYVVNRKRDPLMDQLNSLKSQLQSQRDRLGAEIPRNASGDSIDDDTESRAKREIGRLNEMNQLAAPISPDGQVHLRTGGTVKRETWEKARDAISRY